VADRVVSYGLLISTLNYWHPDCYYCFVHFYFYREDSSLLLIARTLLAICSLSYVRHSYAFLWAYCSQQTSAPLQLLVGAGTVLSCEMADQVLKSVLEWFPSAQRPSAVPHASDAVRNALLSECVSTYASVGGYRSSAERSGVLYAHGMLVMGTPVTKRWRPHCHVKVSSMALHHSMSPHTYNAF
jgi:hypothetical protein